ncbi:MAG: hexitol phosphatase HxpB [Chitinophagaceae bacterium]
MPINTVIFDMDGIIIDSEPLWKIAANNVFKLYHVSITNEEYENTTGLRTSEFLAHWFTHFNIPATEISKAETLITDDVVELIKKHQPIFKGVEYIFNFFKTRNFKIGLATSSDYKIIDAVLEIAGIKHLLDAVASAQECNFGKPNPEVYLQCANKLGSSASDCICFEDSINGMIAAKAAKMKCIVVPAAHQAKDARWSLADLQISSLQNFNELLLFRL